MSQYDQSFYDDQQTGSRRSAEVVLPIVLGMMTRRPTSVVDVGCGVGTWLATATRLGVPEIHGVDGEYVPRDRLHMPSTAFESHDLSSPYATQRRYDLALSLEVAEHLPESRADSFVRDLTKLAPMVLFSAAAPHQPGTTHINCQWPKYWITKFASEGFQVVDTLRPRIWDDPTVEWWYAQNCLLFVAASDLLRSGEDGGDWRGTAVVHPRMFEEICARPVTLRELVESSPALLKQVFTSTAWRARRVVSRAVPRRR